MINKLKNKTIWFNLLIVQVLSHIIFKVTFLNNINEHFQISSSLFSNNLELDQFFLESPTYLLIANILNINSLNNFMLFIYMIFQLCLFLIVFNLDFLDNYSTLFLFSGWLVTSSWYLGFVDIITVTFLVLIVREILKGNPKIFKLIIYYFFLSFNHYAIAIFSTFSLFVLIDKQVRKVFLLSSLTGLVTGYSLLFFVLQQINFQGRSRLRFIFNDGVLKDSINFISNNLIEFLWSGFLGTIFVLIYMIFNNNYKAFQNYIFVFLISIFGTSLGLDTSRIFSILLIPLILKIIYDFKNYQVQPLFFKASLFLVVVSTLFFEERHIYGTIRNESPHLESFSLYDLISVTVNSIFSGIWK